jgi:hypothetical protein
MVNFQHSIKDGVSCAICFYAHLHGAHKLGKISPVSKQNVMKEEHKYMEVKFQVFQTSGVDG